MKNKEFYFDEIVRCFCANNNNTNCALTRKILQVEGCAHITCRECSSILKKALEEEYVPVIDWTKVPKDTLVYVTDCENNLTPEKAIKRYFYKYEPDEIDGKFACYCDGRTSETYSGIDNWEYCRLAKDEDIEKYSR